MSKNNYLMSKTCQIDGWIDKSGAQSRDEI